MGTAKALGEILPLGNRTKAFVQEDHGRRGRVGRPDPGEFETKRPVVPCDVDVFRAGVWSRDVHGVSVVGQCPRGGHDGGARL